MKILILTEGGKRIGFGHIARCISLVQAFKKSGNTPQLLINGDSDIDGLLKEDIPFKFENWPKNYKKVLKGANDIIIIDSYLASQNIYNEFFHRSKLCVYLDDFKRINYPPGIIVNGAIYAKTLGFKKKKSYSYLLGPQFALLRKPFWNDEKKKISRNIRTVLIILGGYDLRNISEDILTLLTDSYRFLIKKLVINPESANFAKIKKIKDDKTELICLPGPDRLQDLMLEADVAISGGGQTLYELARVGVPAVGICLAENQRKNLEIWEKEGFLIFAGHYDTKDLSGNVRSSFNKMDRNRRIKMSAIGRKYVDGFGALRIVDRILEFGKE